MLFAGYLTTVCFMFLISTQYPHLLSDNSQLITSLILKFMTNINDIFSLLCIIIPVVFIVNKQFNVNYVSILLT